MSPVKHLITFAKVYLSLVIIFHEEAKETFKFLIRITAPITGEDNGTPLQYFCLENPMGGGAC